jgi:hypothetical protein
VCWPATFINCRRWNRDLIGGAMTTARDLEYQAQYQKRLRADARASGKSQLNVTVPVDLVDRLDGLKQARGLTNRNDALALLLREYFERGENERNPAVSA